MTGIVILSYNNAEQTLLCVNSILEHCSRDGFRIVVVDNCSREDQAARLRDIVGELSGRCDIELLRSEVNGGYARGNDIGLERLCDGSGAVVDKLLVLNDDTRFTCDILTPMSEYLDNHRDCGVVFPLVLAPDGSVDRACARRAKTNRDLVLQAGRLEKMGKRLAGSRFGRALRCNCLSCHYGLFQRREFIDPEPLRACQEVATQVPPGSCMMFEREFFKSIGFLDPGTFLYFEEHILGKKLEAAGRTCVLLPQINIIHLGAQSTCRQPSKTIYRHWRHSYLYYMKAYSDMPWLLRQALRFRTWLTLLLRHP